MGRSIFQQLDARWFLLEVNEAKEGRCRCDPYAAGRDRTQAKIRPH